MREENRTEQNSASRLDVTLCLGIESACRGKEFEGENEELRSIDTNSTRAKYGEHEDGA